MARDVHRLPCLAAAALCFAALGSWPYGFYTLLRWIVMAAALFLATYGYSRVADLEDPSERQWWSWAAIPGLLALAVLFNPLVPFTMERGSWAPVDMVAGVVFAVGSLVTFDLRRVPAADWGTDSWEPARGTSWLIRPQGLGKWVLGAAILLGLFLVSAHSTVGGDPDCVGYEPGEC